MRRFVLFIIALLFFSSFNTISSDDPVISAAQKELQSYLALIPAGRESLYGFPCAADLKNCTVGKPYQLLKLSTDFYQGTYTPETDYLVMGNEWRVPVVSGGTNCSLLTVTSQGGNYNVVDMGGALLSRELQQASAQTGSGDQFYILRIYTLHADFFVDAKTSSASDASFFPLTSAIMAMPSLQNKSYSLSEVLPVIKTASDLRAKTN
jgi:hypothetical protein